MGYVMPKGGDWEKVEARSIEGQPISWRPATMFVKSLGFDAMESGLYILEDSSGDFYFTCHSADLEYFDNNQLVEYADNQQYYIAQLQEENSQLQKIKEILNG